MRKLIFLIIVLLNWSCRRDVDEKTGCDLIASSYTTDIRPLIETNCAIPGCHRDGASTGDFTTYEGLKDKADNGTFKLRVLDMKIMPPASRPPLSDSDLQKLKCWLEGGAGED